MLKFGGCNNSQNIWDYVWFLCEIVDDRKSLIAVFQADF